MIVAWQFIARNAPRPEPSRRERYDRFAVDICVITRGDRSGNRKSHRALRDGSIIGQASGPVAAGPGYDHSVPPGQTRVSPIRDAPARPLLAPSS